MESVPTMSRTLGREPGRDQRDCGGGSFRGASVPFRLAVLTILAVVLGAGCVPLETASRYEVQGVEPESLRALVPAVALNFRWEWSARDSFQILRNRSEVGGFRAGIVFNEGSFVVLGPGSVKSGRLLSDLIASCIVQEHRLRAGAQPPVAWTTKSHWKYAGATLVSPVWSASYGARNDPFTDIPQAWYLAAATIDAIGLALLIPDDTREAGLYTLAGWRLLSLPYGMAHVTAYNRMQHAPYTIELMREPGFSTLGLRVVGRKTFGWP